MRTMLIVAVAVPMFSGCGLELLTTTAITSELAAQNANVASRVLDQAKTATSQTNAQHAIDLYRADKGHNPPSLEALVPEYLSEVPRRSDGTPYGYDPAGGRLLDTPQVPATALTDAQKLQTLAEAVQRYGRETGRYPVSLWSLVPNYVPQLPKTANGLDFLYDPRNGGVYLPPGATSPAMPQPPPRTRAMGGGSPMGEAMTGIGISNQLDNMSHAGSSAAQGRAGANLGQIQDQHNARQQRALNDLGL